MPAATTPEAAAIEAAYGDQVKTLFGVLMQNLIAEPVSHTTDQQCAQKFATGMQIAKRAKDLALGSIGTTLSLRRTGAARSKKARTR
jgi:hypothetical protein